MMSSPNPNPTSLLFLLIIFSIASFKLSYCINFCPEIEKQSLLSFKQSLEDPDNTLSSWNINGEVNCCKWKGVACNNYTGHVHKLYLQSYYLSGKLNPSLLNLKHLRYLDLSQNYFEETIPSFIGSFQGLEYLDLSLSGFNGTIPHTIGNLSSLRTLCLGYTETYEINHLKVDSFEWLSGLSQLEQLNMNGVNLSAVATTWVQVINTLSSLVELNFSSCSLNFIAPLNDFVNVSSLAFLDLSQNEFQSSVIPKWIFQLSELTYLDLSVSNLEGPIPNISNITKLQWIDLSSNNLNSAIPDWLYFNRDLKLVDLQECDLHGVLTILLQ
ncbi:Non-specific serine/threonine protein kinase [Handroanthus impetiginosus]|uniref:Non-specific serine/threonine protein kinase n=1 Tax=Handroanthus impetiginosus TaxID=429701 RepID=A0A2G9GRC6_9LAMI|nr:Non-specific serine/threonine protein kinase [Handroanthus impetiginosus]